MRNGLSLSSVYLHLTINPSQCSSSSADVRKSPDSWLRDNQSGCQLPSLPGIHHYHVTIIIFTIHIIVIICIFLIVILFIAKSIRQRHRQRYRQRHRRKLSASNTQCMVYFFISYSFKEFTS